MAENLDLALEYLRIGWIPVPLKWTGTPEDLKRPLVSWEMLQTVRPTVDQVRGWFREWPLANLGIITGEESGLIALDLDGPDAPALLRSAGVDFPAGGTPTSKTGKGHHIFLKHPGKKVPNGVRLLRQGVSGVDVRGDGGYVVAPPSIHGSGRKYEWIVSHLTPLLECPPAALRLIFERGKVRELREPDWVSKAMKGVPEGQRNDVATRLAGHYLALTKGSVNETTTILESFADRCQPPMPHQELRSVIESVARREKQKPQYSTFSLISAPEFVSLDFPARGSYLGNGDLPKAGTMILAGPGGVGKSMLCIQLAMHMAYGTKALDAFPVHEKPTTGLFILEDQPGETQKRLRAMAADQKLPQSLMVFTRNEPIRLAQRSGRPNEQALFMLERTILAYGLQVIVLDPLVKLHEADENSNSEMARWLYRLSDVCHGCGCSLLISHHVNWGGLGESHARGASAIQNWADCVWKMLPTEEGGQRAVKLSVDKINFGPKWEPLILSLDQQTMMFTAKDVAMSVCPVNDLLDYIGQDWGGEVNGRVKFYEAASQYFSCSQKSIRRSIEQAVRGRFLLKRGNTLVIAGRDAAGQSDAPF